jgi:hypothetical protein
VLTSRGGEDSRISEIREKISDSRSIWETTGMSSDAKSVSIKCNKSWSMERFSYL